MFKHYTMNQVILPLDLEIKLQENDIAYAVNDIVEQIPDEAFADFLHETGCPAYHPRMMMKIILTYTQSVFSGRKIEALLKDSVRMMWLAQGYEPSYRTINRFRVNEEKNYYASVSYSFAVSSFTKNLLKKKRFLLMEPK